MDQAVLRISAVKADQHLWKDVKFAISKGGQMVSIAGAIATAVVCLTAPFLASTIFHDPDLVFPIRIMSLSIIPFGLLNMIAEALRGLKKILQSSFVQALGIPLFSCILFGIATMAKATISAAVFAYLAATLITVFIAIRFCKWAVPSEGQINGAVEIKLRNLIQLSIPMGWAYIMVIIMGMTDSIVLGIFRSSEEMGIYAAALRLSMLVTIAFLAVNSIAAPKFAALYSSHAMHSLEKLSQRATLLILFTASPLLVLFFIIPDQIMGIFGPEFRQGGTLLRILSVGQLVTMTMGTVGYLLLMTKYENVMKWLNSTAALTNITLSFIFIPIWGGVGAALANATSLVLLNLMAFISVWKLLKISSIPFLTRAKTN
jgi:O-antigen/teichoic acid export membrane protein